MEENKKIFINGEEVGIVDKNVSLRGVYNDNLEKLEREVYKLDKNIKRTDEQRLKDHGIDSLDRLLEECILISQKQSKLPRLIRDIIVRISVEAFKELNMKAEEIKKESLENNTKENDRQEQ